MTTTKEASAREAVGALYSLDLMRQASARSWLGIERARQRIRPGMRESEARLLVREVLDELGMQRIWHPVLVRFGSNTTRIFKEPSEGDPVLAQDDIYFIDIGTVFDGHEGDVGATFTTGGDAEMAACAAAARTLFDATAQAWRQQGLSGPALYAFAAERAQSMGWTLNLDIKGHRVSEFPHAVYRGGALGDLDQPALPGVWILEIQIAHPSRPYGAFYEDLLV